jgi:peptidoglycan/LPS O-acetylase OafA/YrhL
MALSMSPGRKNIAADLTWIDILKGVAIIGVFLDNWTIYNGIHFPLWGPFVQVFFILSGFGLTIAYLKSRARWNWKQWGWRRFTKIVVPYIILVIFSFMLGILGSSLYASIDRQFSWLSLLTYLTFTRNFYPPSWAWNPPLWFMPVIIGLYFSFPVLTRIMDKRGLKALVGISLLVTFGSLTLAVVSGLYKGHESDLFTFWMIQFAMGMVLASVRDSQPHLLNRLIGLGAFLIGVVFFAISYGLRTYVPYGKTYNDLFTSVGIFLILLNMAWYAWLLVPPLGTVLYQLGKKSYLMYLIHFPMMVFLIGPLVRPYITNSIIGTILGGIYIGAIYLLCTLISPLMDKLSSWLYALLFPRYPKDVPAFTIEKKASL